MEAGKVKDLPDRRADMNHLYASIAGIQLLDRTEDHPKAAGGNIGYRLKIQNQFPDIIQLRI